MRSLIRHLKTLPDIDIIRILAPRLGERLLDEVSERQTFGFPRNLVLVPIPLSQKRFIERGYNQAKLIAKELTHSLPRTTTRILLQRTSRYVKQALVSDRAARFQNQSGSMRVTEPLDPGIGYIIIDDVTTSGATLAEAKRALRAAGAKHVIAGVLAH